MDLSFTGGWNRVVKTGENRWSRIGWLVALLLTGVAPLRAQVNSWTNPGTGKWEVATNWDLGVPPSTNDTFDHIFTGSTVTIDATTSGSFPDSLTVNYLSLIATGGVPLTLRLDNADTNVPLHVLKNLSITGGGLRTEVLITNSALQVDGLTALGISALTDEGTLELDAGWATLSDFTVGNHGIADLYLNGGTLTVLGTMAIGSMSGSYAGAIMTGGTLIHTNNTILLGDQGTGVFVMSGGSVQAPGIQLGNGAGSQGSLSVSGGTVLVSSNVLIGNGVVTNPCSVTVTNTGTLAVTNAAHNAYIDINGQSNTLTLNGGLLQVDNLILTNGGSFIDNSGTLDFTKPFQLENGSSVTIGGGTVTTFNNFTLATSLNSIDYLAVVNGGTLNVSNATLGLGNNGLGILSGAGVGIATVSNGTLNASSINLGSMGGGSGSLTIQGGGTVNVDSNLVMVSGSLTSTSTVAVASGTLNASNGMIGVGLTGNGQMIIAGTVTAHRVQVGGTPGSASGSVYVTAGGKLISPSISANYVAVNDGGEIDGSGGALVVAENHDAAVFVGSGGFITDVSTVTVGASNNYTGTLTIDSGSWVQVTSNLIVGDCSGNAVGDVILNGGTLYVTNADHRAFLDVRDGTVTLNSGSTLVVDNLFVTNACGHFVNNGGTIVYNDPLMPGPVLAPNEDADGDGMSNANEMLAGTDPLDPTSVFQMLGATVSNRSVWVTWTTVGGHSYVVQSNSNLNSGSFHDFSPLISVPGTNPGTMSYPCTPNLTNNAGFYRVRLAVTNSD
jgi:hypothetical protein